MVIEREITVELPSREVSVRVNYTMEIEDHGVGWTEAWGYRSFDSHKVWEVQKTEVCLDKNHDFTKDEIELIQEAAEAWFEDDSNHAELVEAAIDQDEGLREDAAEFRHDVSRLEDY